MSYRKLNYKELASVSGGGLGWGDIISADARLAYSAWKHRRSMWAGYKASPFH